MNSERDEQVDPEVTAPRKPSRVWPWMHKAEVIGGFLWWMVKVIDWAIQSRGLNRVEFPRFTPEKLKGSNQETLFGETIDKKDPK